MIRKKYILFALCLCAALMLAGCSHAEISDSSAEPSANQSDNADTEQANPETNSKISEDAYSWSNVAIGGGGYVTGIVYSEAEENLIYARTDIGGAYRWIESEQRWKAITDHLGAENWNLIGIESIAADPVDAGRVYALGGTYMGNHGAVLVSDDYGETWEQHDMPFDCGANNSGRGTGERLKVNPLENRIIYMGTRNAGLWKSEDFGKTWNAVESFPTKGDYSQESNAIGIMWVEFNPVNNDIYVGVAQKDGNCIYTSSDNGTSWNALPTNLAGMYPLHGDFSTDGKLYLAYSDNCGPNMSPQNGAVCVYQDGTFTDITPSLDDGRYGGFGAVSADRQNPDTLVVCTLGYWSDNGDNVYRSTDGGQTWQGLFDTKNHEKHYIMNVEKADWLTWGREEAKTGWWTADININPFNSDEVMYGTGATVYCTENITELGSDKDVVISFAAYGLEETAVYQMLSPNYQDGQPQLYSIMGDLTGFSHLDVTVCPDDAHFMGSASGNNPTDLDVAYENADCAVYAVQDKLKPLWFTTDGGQTWNPVPNVPEKVEGGRVCMSADGSVLLWTPANTGNSNIYQYNLKEDKWYYAEGLGYGAQICADRVNPKKFYAAYNGMFYISTDGGVKFTSTGQLIADKANIQTVAGKEGNVWLCSGTLLMYSEDSGQSFTSVKNIDFKAIGFGAPKSEKDYPAVYAMGNAGQGEGIYRSLDKGMTWERINDENHLFGNLTSFITGDSRVFGRVYFATNGRGIVMGDIAQ